MNGRNLPTQRLRTGGRILRQFVCDLENCDMKAHNVTYTRLGAFLVNFIWAFASEAVSSANNPTYAEASRIAIPDASASNATPPPHCCLLDKQPFELTLPAITCREGQAEAEEVGRGRAGSREDGMPGTARSGHCPCLSSWRLGIRPRGRPRAGCAAAKGDPRCAEEQAG
jgi:hypothetical protein